MASKISVIAPIYNEAATVPELYRRLRAVLEKLVGENFEIVMVNDGSRDNSLDVLRLLASQDARVKYISFSRNFGHQIAVSAGLDITTGDAVVIIDGDLQDPPECIEDLYRRMQEGFKVVYAKRRSRAGETVFKKFTAKMFYRILANITSVDIPLDTGDFRIIDKQIVEQLRLMPERSKFLRGQISWVGFKQTFIEYDRQERVAGTTGYSLGKMIRFALDGITGFSSYPLRLASYFGFLVSGMAFLVILYALYSKFINDAVITGWTSIIISSMFIGGIQLLTIGVIGEYISRINDDVKGRPLYIVEETNFEK